MTKNTEIRKNIELVEEAYEFMLAYAAQGRADEGAGPDGAHIRTFLTQFSKATDNIINELDNLSELDGTMEPFIKTAKSDADTVKSVLAIMLQKENVSSEMVDNANGLIIVRSYLTALFFIDKAVLN
jgi:hypothetical protein